MVRLLKAATGGVLQKKVFLKNSQYPQKTTVLESFLKKVAALKACNFIKKRPQHRHFGMNIAKFLRLGTYFEQHLRTAVFLQFQWFAVT